MPDIAMEKHGWNRVAEVATGGVNDWYRYCWVTMDFDHGTGAALGKVAID
jgi:hypothetical protein